MTSRNKTAPINLMVLPEVKRKLREKAMQLNLNLTQFLEKVALEDVIFLDKNIKKVFSLMAIKT